MTYAYKLPADSVVKPRAHDNGLPIPSDLVLAQLAAGSVL